MKSIGCLLFCEILNLAVCVGAAEPGALPLKPAEDSITAANLLRHIKVLASDEFEGRAPGSKGEELLFADVFDR